MSVQQIDWDLALIQKYNYSGPRYTSYPTALEFSEDFGEQAFLCKRSCSVNSTSLIYCRRTVHIF